MIKQIQKVKQFLFGLFEKELLALIALLVVSVSMFSVQAQTSDHTDLFFTICPADGSITVTAANGRERWLVNSGQSITWTTCDPNNAITDVKIELQRSTGGTWETIIASTPDDGSYGWSVTEPTTTTALIRISDASDPTVSDTSNGVFEIYKSGGGPPPPSCIGPVIDKVVPLEINNDQDTILTITGYFTYGNEQVYLDEELLDSEHISNSEIIVLVPAGFPTGRYILSVRTDCGVNAEYWPEVVVIGIECRDPVISSVDPVNFTNTKDTILTIRGQFEYGDEEVFLGEEPLYYGIISETEIEAGVPAGFPPGTYTLAVNNGCGGRAEYAIKITVSEEEEEDEEDEEDEEETDEEEEIGEPLEPLIDIILRPILDLFKPSVEPPSTGGIAKPKVPSWVVPDGKFYTDQFERNWICYLVWFIILLIFALLLKDYFTEDDPKKKRQKDSPSVSLPN